MAEHTGVDRLHDDIQALRVYISFLRPFDVNADDPLEIARDSQAEIIGRLKQLEADCERLRAEVAALQDQKGTTDVE